MESNRDDAERCLQLASSALEAGDIAKATRLLEKSRRMYPLRAQQDRLFNAIQHHSAKRHSHPLRDSSSSNTTEQPEPTSNATSTSSQREPSPQMVAAVADIQKVRNKSHYEVLRLPRDCDQNDIKKAYRKLALRLHPDRNFAPGADEAFKRVGQAFITLSDPKRREYYDRTGADEPGQLPRTNLRRRRNFARANSAATDAFDAFVDDSEMFPEELFEFMCARASAGDSSFRRAPRNSPTNPPSFLQRLKPFVFLALFAMLTILVSDKRSYPTFSLNPTPYHTIRGETKNHVTYYIPRNLALSRESQRHLQRQVDLKALDEYRLRCAEEREHAFYLWRQSRRWFISRATRALYKEKYDSFDKPWCRKTQELHDRLLQY